jgi:hypothetical protein
MPPCSPGPEWAFADMSLQSIMIPWPRPPSHPPRPISPKHFTFSFGQQIFGGCWGGVGGGHGGGEQGETLERVCVCVWKGVGGGGGHLLTSHPHFSLKADTRAVCETLRSEKREKD